MARGTKGGAKGAKGVAKEAAPGLWAPGARAGLRLPRMVVFDLDACVWDPEMCFLPNKPTVVERGPLPGVGGEGVVSLGCAGRRGPKVRMFPGAVLAIQEMLTSPDWEGVSIAAASSSEEPTYSFACLEALEVMPGRTLGSVFDFLAVGRTGELSSDKKTHFTKLHTESGMPFEEMLFFDDCIWGDNVGRVNQVFGVLGIRTPDGITAERWEAGLQLFHERRGASSSDAATEA